VNGEVTMRDGQPTNAHSGRLLRHGGAQGRTARAA